VLQRPVGPLGLGQQPLAVEVGQDPAGVEHPIDLGAVVADPFQVGEDDLAEVGLWHLGKDLVDGGAHDHPAPRPQHRDVRRQVGIGQPTARELAVGQLPGQRCAPHLAVVEVERGRVPPRAQLLGGQHGQLHRIGGAGAGQQELGHGAPLFGRQCLPDHHQQIDVAAVGVEAGRRPRAVEIHADQVVAQDHRKLLRQVLGEADGARGAWVHAATVALLTQRPRAPPRP
jgi:hypothetical protein